MKGPFKNDKYKRNRGGSSKILGISCRVCQAKVCSYQKDGPGALLRMYVDRIIESQVKLTEEGIFCPNGHLLGVRIIYKKENRLAFRLVPDSIIKTKAK